MQLSRDNNFDAIRLIAALQVVFGHSVKHLQLINDNSNTFLIFIKSFIGRFPGVPIFFTVSGFLVYWSLERNQNNIKKFFKNRMLRIFPGLWMCFAITLILIFSLSIINMKDILNVNFISWFFAQMTIFQFYTPEMLRVFGIGTPNGSLWTITVEIQYYFLLPIMFFLVKKFKNRVNQNIVLLLLVVLSLCFAYYIKGSYEEDSLVYKLSMVNVFTYLYNFIFGILIYKNWDILKKYLEGKALIWFIVYVLYVLTFYFYLEFYGLGYIPNLFGVFSFLLLSILTISFAYSKPNISRYLKGSDISYGVYIYHMIVLNALIHLKINPIYSFVLTFVITVLLGWFSWEFIEKRALMFKKSKI